MSNFQLRITVIEAFGLQKTEKNNGTTDPFVVAKIRGSFLKHVQTSIVTNNLSPYWNQELLLSPKNTSDVLVLKIYDKDRIKNNFIGMVEIPLEKFFQQGPKDHWLQLMNRKSGWKRVYGGHPSWFSVPGQLHVQLWFGIMGQANPFAGLASSGQFVPSSQNQLQSSGQFVEPLNLNYTPQSTGIIDTNGGMSSQPMRSDLSFPDQSEQIRETFVTSAPDGSIITQTTTTTQTYPHAFHIVNEPDKFQWYKQGLVNDEFNKAPLDNQINAPLNSSGNNAPLNATTV